MPTIIPQAIAEDLCDRVAFIVDGQIRLIDTPRALRLRYGKPCVRLEPAEILAALATERVLGCRTKNQEPVSEFSVLGSRFLLSS